MGMKNILFFLFFSCSNLARSGRGLLDGLLGCKTKSHQQNKKLGNCNKQTNCQRNQRRNTNCKKHNCQRKLKLNRKKKNLWAPSFPWGLWAPSCSSSRPSWTRRRPQPRACCCLQHASDFFFFFFFFFFENFSNTKRRQTAHATVPETRNPMLRQCIGHCKKNEEKKKKRKNKKGKQK
jgi:hypothetical protein